MADETADLQAHGQAAGADGASAATAEESAAPQEEPVAGATGFAEKGAGDQALEAVASIESQLGEVLSSLDGLAGAGGGGLANSLLGSRAGSAGGTATIDLLRDVMLSVKIELGRSRMYIEDILKLGEGSVVELDKLAGDPVDVFVNDRLVARGEVLVLNDNFCVRIGEIVAQD
jgi:flagellar motor switch protein FliN/FliY